MPDMLCYSLLTAGAVDTPSRVISGPVFPSDGRPSQTSLGMARITPGCVTWPEQPRAVKLCREHQHADTVGFALVLDWLDDGACVGQFSIPPGPNGDRALQEARDGIRDGLSAGLTHVQGHHDQDGVFVVTAARLREVSLVTIPAFEGAMLDPVMTAALTEGDHMSEPVIDPTDPTDQTDQTPPTPMTITGTPVSVTIIPEVSPVDQAAAETSVVEDRIDDGVSVADIPTEDIPASDLTASLRPGRRAFRAPRPGTTGRVGPVDVTRQRLVQLLTRAGQDRTGTGYKTLTAALSDVITPDTPMATRPVYSSEIILGATYQRRFVERACTMQPLPAGMTIVYPRWVQAPAIEDYAGDKTAVPSGPVEMDDVTVSLKRVAAAWNFDRIYWDRGDGGFLDAFLERLGDSYLRKTNADAVDAAINGAAGLPGAASLAPTETLMEGIVSGVVDFASRGEVVDYVAISADLLRTWLDITTMNAPAYFGGAFTLGGEAGTGRWGDLPIFIEPMLPAATYVIGQQRAIKFHEDANPFRIEAPNIGFGGVDVGYFGYIGCYIWNPDLIRQGTVDPDL